jgi:mannitol operon repressor
VKENKNHIELYQKFLAVLKQENDRGAVLSSAAFIEELLEKILVAFLANEPTTKELLKGFSAPIGSFSARLKLCYSLGLLYKELYLIINTIRKIRNLYAHNWEVETLSSEKISSLLVTCPPHPWLKKLYSDRKSQMIDRLWFDTTVSICMLELSLIPIVLEKEKRHPKRLVKLGKPHSTLDEANLASGTIDDHFEY